eukprot:m.109364 g.109364  ORF g.109364 m.109364 type:complete len:340 (+) comp27950_c0_seq2:349-1368(+)
MIHQRQHPDVLWQPVGDVQSKKDAFGVLSLPSHSHSLFDEAMDSWFETIGEPALSPNNSTRNSDGDILPLPQLNQGRDVPPSTLPTSVSPDGMAASTNGMAPPPQWHARLNVNPNPNPHPSAMLAPPIFHTTSKSPTPTPDRFAPSPMRGSPIRGAIDINQWTPNALTKSCQGDTPVINVNGHGGLYSDTGTDHAMAMINNRLQNTHSHTGMPPDNTNLRRRSSDPVHSHPPFAARPRAATLLPRHSSDTSSQRPYPRYNHNHQPQQYEYHGQQHQHQYHHDVRQQQLHHRQQQQHHQQQQQQSFAHNPLFACTFPGCNEKLPIRHLPAHIANHKKNLQ